MNRSSAKDFSKHPHLLDGHVERIKAAHDAAKSYMIDSPLRTVGLIRVKNFLSCQNDEHPGLGLRIADEIYVVRPGDGKRGDSLVTTTRPDSASRACAGAMWQMISALFTAHHTEVARKFYENLYLQHLINMPGDNDEQKVFHTDTFFPAIKWWYFPLAVGANDGPLMYVPNSPILTPKLLAWHQAQVDAIKAGRVEEWRGRGHREGSLRISLEEIAALGLKPEAVTVEADTLVVASVFGFHARGGTTKPTHRLALHGSIRLDQPI